MLYEWDEKKAKFNLLKHGVSFAEAKTVFDDPLYVDFYDPDHSSAEHRFIILGESAGGAVALCFLRGTRKSRSPYQRPRGDTSGAYSL